MKEMIAHLPLFAHKNPKNVLVIGGGDAGVLREVVKHKSVEKVTLCEIDEAVIRTAKQYLPEMAKGFDNEKVEVFVGDGFEYLKNHVNCFDVIITDSSDPIGPAASLFQPEFFSLLKNALKPSGIICSQGESQWLHLEIIAGLVKKTSKLFPVVEYAYTTIPTYPSGQIGFLICSNDETVDVKKVNSDGLTEDQMNELKYYTKELHQASFVLPAFTRRSIEASKNAE
jgi:spermidine synthase